MTQEVIEVVWSWKSNLNPWSLKEPDKWTPYTTTINAQIEQAYLDHRHEIVIDENHRIDL